jgi:hypothetical protein
VTRTDWKSIATQLGNRMCYHADCEVHPASAPDGDCPFCEDRAAYLRYKAAASAAGISTRSHLDDNAERVSQGLMCFNLLEKVGKPIQQHERQPSAERWLAHPLNLNNL